MPNAFIRVTEVHSSRLFLKTGLVSRWASRLAQEVEFQIAQEAPIGHRPNKTDGTAPGWLRETVFSDLSQIGPHQLEIIAGANADYTLYVVKGTGPLIFATSARIPAGEEGGGQFKELGEEGGMYLPANPGYGRAQRRQRVRGQKPNNFIARGYNQAARRHAALKPMGEALLFND